MSKVDQADRKQADPLDAWLERVEASARWQADVPGVGTVTCYLINCQLAIVLRYAEKSAGWELFIPPSNQNSIGVTLDEAALALNVQGCAGLVN